MNDSKLDSIIADEFRVSTQELANRYAPDEAEVDRLTSMATAEAAPLDLKAIGLGDITQAEWDQANQRMGEPVTFGEVDYEKKHIPGLGAGFEFAELAKETLAQLAVGAGKATPEQQRMYLDSIVHSTRERTLMGTFAEVGVGTTPLVAEGAAAMALGAGGTALAARALAKAGLEKAAAATRSTIIKRASQIGLMTAAREGVPQATDAAGLTDFGGGAWSANSLRRALPKMDLPEEKVEALLGMTESAATEALMGEVFDTHPLAKGFGEELLRNTVEFGIGPGLSSLTVGAVKNGIFGAALRRVVTKADDALGVAKKVQSATGLDGPITEILEENISGVAVEARYGEDWTHGLTDEVYEIASIAMLGAIPGASSASLKATKRIMDKRRADARKRMAEAKAAAEATPGMNEPGEAAGSTSEGGDTISPGDAAAATAPAEPGVSPEELAEVRAADVEAFRSEASAAVGRDVELEETQATTREEVAAQQFLRRRGIEPIFVRADDLEGLPRGYFPGEGRAVVVADAPGVIGAAIHESVHTWEAQQAPEARAALSEELRGIDSGFVQRVEDWWRDNALVPNPSADLVAEETRATAAQFLGPMIAYLDTEAGRTDFAKVYEQEPGRLSRTWEAVRDWFASWIPKLKPSQRTQAQARLDELSGNVGSAAPELAQSILGALESIRPAQLQAPAQAEEVPPVRPRKAAQPRQKKERGGKRRAEAAEKAAETEKREAAQQEAEATPADKPRGSKSTPGTNAAERRRATAKKRDALGRSFTPTTYAATVNTEGLIGRGLTPRFSAPITPEGQAALETQGLAVPVNTTASFLDQAQIVTSWDKFRRVVSDEFLALKKYTNTVKEMGGDLAADPTSAVRRYFGKISERADAIERRFTQPILDLLKANGIELESAGDYVYARHVEEANEKFYRDHLERKDLAAQRTAIKREIKDLPRDEQVERDLRQLSRRIDELAYVPIRLPKGVDAREFFHEVSPRSGMKTSEAKRIESEGDAKAGYKQLGALVDKMNRETRNRLLADGLITAEQHEAWSQYEHYVPLRTAEVDKPEGPRTGGLAVRGPESKKRKGRKSKADNPLVMSFVQALNGAQRGEKNAVGLELRDFLQNNRELVGSGERAAELDEKGRPVISEYEFHLKVDGVDTALTLENKDVADALKRIGIPQIPSALAWYATGMRVWRAMVTSANPEFVVNNLIRDVQTALVNVSSVAEEFDLDGVRRDVVKGLRSAGRTVWQFNRPNSSVTTGLGARYDEYRENGGQIGTFSSLDFNEQAKAINRELARAQTESAPKEAYKAVAGKARAGWQFIEDANQAAETATRFSFYNALRDRGVSAKDAAFAARQLTVDFSQKGTWGTAISLVYAFFSAGVGGTRRMVEELARSKRAKQIAGGIALHGFTMSFMNEMLSGEDEDGLSWYSKIPDYEKEQYLLFMPPGGKEPIKILMPWGYSAFSNLGRLAAETVAGKRSAGSAAGSMMAVAAANFNPLGTAPSLGQFLSPTLVDPIIQVQENQNFAGAPIAPSENPFGAERAAFARSGRDTYDHSIWIAKQLNELTGGDDVRPGWLNLAGDHVQHLEEFLGGGIGRFIERAVKSGIDTAQGEFNAEAAPFIRSVYGARTEFVDRENFYKARNEIDYQKAEIKLAKDEKDFERVRELQARYRHTLRLDKRMRTASKEAAKLKDAAYAGNKFDPDEKLLDQADAKLKAVFKEYVVAVQKNAQR